MTLEILNRLAAANITVVGDIMIDIYLHGEVSRLSPEAPVPVVCRTSEHATAGGAANVVANIASLGAMVSLVGVVGDDGGLDKLEKLFDAGGRVDLGGVVIDPSRLTTQKTRVLGHRHQIVRIDHEDRRLISGFVEDELIERAMVAVDRADILVLSDYGKGVLSDGVLHELISYAASRDKKIIVDPKRRDFSAYQGATILTPNRTELALATGLSCETDEEAAIAAIHAHSASSADILLTRSEKGMSFFPREGSPVHMPTVSREVFDVSGAGDTVIAALAACLAAGRSIEEGMKVANHAAGVVVGKAGTATVSIDELEDSLGTDLTDEPVDDGRPVGREEARALRRAWLRRGYTVGFANGCFDLLHPGHISLIRQATRVCDRLIVALNSDASVRRLKGPTRPVQNERARAEVIGAMKGVALVVLFDEDTPLALIKALQPDVLIKGADYAGKEVVGAEIVKARGGKVLLTDLVEGQSTTRLLTGAR